MNIPNNVARAFNKAVTSIENSNPDGSVNWNFVDADTFMDSGQSVGEGVDNSAFYKQFDYLAYCYEGKITLADRIKETQFEVYPGEE